MLEADTVVQGRYRVISQIGKGGMGTVYVARDENLGVTIALKQNFFDDQRLIEAFKREARLLAGLRHPALPQVKDYFINDAGQFLVMEHIAGDDFGAILEKRRQTLAPAGEPKPFEVNEVLRWAEQLLDALDYLHTLPDPVIHRDIKPQNLKLAGRNQIILLDFGLAKGKPLWMTRVTTSGSLYGYTPNYAPLEQIRGGGTDPRSDLYALGATVYHLLTGAPPVDAATRADTFIGGELDPLRAANEVNPKVPREIAAVLMKAMEQHRNKRPASAAEMLEMLRAAKFSTVIDPQAQREQARIADPKDAWPETEIATREWSEGEQRRIADAARQEEQERKAREEIERRRQQEEEERRAREAAETLRQQREQEERERIAREEAAKLRQEQERKAREEAERRKQQEEQNAQEEAELLRQREEELHRPRAEVRIEQERKDVRGWKAVVAIVASMVLVAVVIWAITSGLNKPNEPLPNPQPIGKPADTAAPGRLKAGVFTTPNKVTEVSFSDDGEILASSEETAIRLWQTDIQRQLSVPKGGKCVAVSHDGQLVASGGGDNIVSLENASDWKLLKRLTGHSGMVFSVGFSPDRQTLYSASYDKTIKLWRVSDGGLIKTVSTPEKGYLIVAVSPDLRLVGFYRADGSFKLWSLEQDDLIRMLEGDVRAVNCGAFSRDGQMLALGSSDGDVQLWRVSDGRLIKSLGKLDAKVMSLAFSADGRVLAAGSENGAIGVWRISDGQLVTTFTGHSASVNSLSFTDDGRTLASGSSDKTVRIWDVKEN